MPIELTRKPQRFELALNWLVNAIRLYIETPKLGQAHAFEYTDQSFWFSMNKTTSPLLPTI